MTKEEFAVQAAAECASGVFSGGYEGRPFWNAEAFQFMYAPTFQFQPLPGTRKYRYCAVDAEGKEHVFEAAGACASLEPVWKDIPEGVVTLTVYALDNADGQIVAYTAGTRTFFRLSPFTADLEGPACGYREAAMRAYDYAMSQSFLRYWLEKGIPDPDYDHNVYPSKMITAIINSMLKYAEMCPERAGDAMKIARNSADYLIGITAKSGPMEGIPPTYQIDFRPDPETRKNLSAASRINWVMMIYPPRAGDAYLNLYDATGDKKYYDAAMKIGDYFRATVEKNGTWYLIRDIRTGEVLAGDYCDPLLYFVPFLMNLYEHTGNEEWKTLADNSIAYMERVSLPAYNWGGQFEDSQCSVSYSNLTHYSATALVRYYLKYYRDDEKKMTIADELMRFAEDQFVIWKKPSPWNRSHFDTSLWLTPCALEQYNWHVPIDASTADLMTTFLAMYQAGKGDIYLEKARALADSITRAQQPDGMIPTHWMSEKYMKGSNLWINCLLYTAGAMIGFSRAVGE